MSFWQQAQPIWATATEQGLKVSTYLWGRYENDQAYSGLCNDYKVRTQLFQRTVFLKKNLRRHNEASQPSFLRQSVPRSA